jgi:hypothetical protein
MTLHNNNYAIFRECISGSIAWKPEGKPTRAKRRNAKRAKHDLLEDASTEIINERADPEELAEFIDFIASEIFSTLPSEIQILSYSSIQQDNELATRLKVPISRSLLDSLTVAVPLSVSESLSVYGLIPESSNLPEFLNSILNDYLLGVTTGPPVWQNTRKSACEICERDWIPLSYHHLIPKQVHSKVLKRGWHEEWKLNSVAWLCRACHCFVHRMASNEDLARNWYTVDRILEREDVQEWARWVGRVRWKAK